MHPHYRTRGIFLKKEDRGETDQIFTVFTEDFGKLEILGKAIRKITSKLRAGADVFYFSEIEFIQGKNYKTLTDAILIDKFKELRENPLKLDAGYEIIEVLDSLVGREEPDPKLWQLLMQTLKLLDNLKLDIRNSLEIRNLKLEILLYYFLWNLFAILGYSPELYHCPVCRKKLLPETLFFVPREGGVVCWQCLAGFKKERDQQKNKGERQKVLRPEIWKEIIVDTVKTVRIFLKEPPETTEKLRIAESTKRNLRNISEFYLSFLKEVMMSSGDSSL